MSVPNNTTKVACLTPPGTAAIAVLALYGPRAWSVLRELFLPHPKARRGLPAEPDTSRFWLGRLGEGVADNVVVSVRAQERGPWVEVHCHGGAQVVHMLLALFQKQGIQQCGWQEFFQLSAADSLQAAAAVALAAAPTLRTASILLDQHAGAFRRALDAILAACNGADLSLVDQLLEELVQLAPIGRHLITPWRVVVAGAPNVGKSSLINALAGYQRSIVSPTPGTTRDLVSTLIAVEGWPVELVDTAGMREQALALEEQGIQRARSAAATADLCLWVLDASTPTTWPPAGLVVQLVVNKVDLPVARDLAPPAEAIRVSARYGTGLAELGQALARWLVPREPAPGGAVPFSPELCAAVKAAWQYRRNGRTADAARLLRALQQQGR